MSHQNVVKFMERLLSDEALQSEAFSLVAQDEDKTVQELIDYATEAGFPFSEKELDELILAAAVQEAGGELSLEELGSVAGGTDSIVSAQPTLEQTMSFNMQLLQLQQQMAAESRQFTMVSNIMKTRHDTAKASINNLR